jgi:hypothetical protein
VGHARIPIGGDARPNADQRVFADFADDLHEFAEAGDAYGFDLADELRESGFA